MTDQDWQWCSAVLLFSLPPYVAARGSDAADPSWQEVSGGLSHIAIGSRQAAGTDLFSSSSIRSTKENTYSCFARSALRQAILSTRDDGSAHAVWKALPALSQNAGLDDLESAGIHVTAVSISEDADGATHVAVHLAQTGAALREPSWLPAALQRPTRVPPLTRSDSTQLTGGDLQGHLNRVFDSLGIDASISNGGFVQWNAQGAKIEHLGDLYTIVAAVPSGGLPDRDGYGPEERRPAEVRWARALATSQTSAATPVLSDLSDGGVADAVVSLGPVTAWCGETGIGLVASAPPHRDREVWAAEVTHAVMLAHSVFVDLAFLTREQDRFLHDRAKTLAGLALRNHEEDPGDVAEEYRKVQGELVRFLGSQWFREIPRREAATRVLRGMQSARYLADRLTHATQEQEAHSSYLEAFEQAQLAKARAAEARTRRYREKVNFKLQLAAAIFLPTTLVFTVLGGYGRVIGDAGLAAAWIVSGIVTVGLIGWAILDRHHQSQERAPSRTG